MSATPSSLGEAIVTVVSYLAETDPRRGEPYDAVIGFGMFDLGLPRFCGDLYQQGAARLIVFTGGIGAGTGDLGGPEADVWRDELSRSHPAISDDAVVVENRSTNTAENVAFTAEWLQQSRPEFALGRGITRVLVVASPTRLRRVWLTIRRQQPSLELARCLPALDIDADVRLYAAQRIDYAAHLAGELDRLVSYADRDWIVGEPLPDRIEAARAILRCAGR